MDLQNATVNGLPDMEILRAMMASDAQVPLVSIVVAIITVALYYLCVPAKAKLPLINPNRTFEWSTARVRKEWLAKAKEIIGSGIAKYPGKPFNMMAADVGTTTVLPPEYANEIRNNPNLSFVKFMGHLFFSYLPGFEPTREGMFDNDIGIIVIQKFLTSLARMTQPLSEESESALQDIYTDSYEWHEENLKAINLKLVARLSSRIFLGEELCRNEEWLKITVDYTVDLMKAAEQLRQVPGPLRRIVHWWLPEAKHLRAEVKKAGEIIRPILEARREEKRRRKLEGQEPIDHYDAIEWFEQVSGENRKPYDPEIVQLFLSTVAIHTTSDLLTVTMLDIARHPEIVEPLREEVKSVLENGGWKKTALHDMKLMDSVLKESLRLKPIGIVSMRRVASSAVKLSNGTHLPRGTKLAVSSHLMWDPTVYPSPNTWDPYRFLRLRDADATTSTSPVKSKEALFVSTSERHLGFGHGKHGCPGRFFAGSELKVALAHILLKYDFKLKEGATVQHRITGASFYADPFASLLIRRRRGASEI